MFVCTCCAERFPTFHPAYVPPSTLNLDLLKLGASGAPACNMLVASWDEVPPFRETEEGLLVTKKYAGICLRCQKDIDKQQQSAARGDFVLAPTIPRWSYRNWMDPCWKFPWDDLSDLFLSLTTTEWMLLALEHMQVNVLTLWRTHLNKFRKNCVSFPQDSGAFFARMHALKGFRVGDRVNVKAISSDASGLPGAGFSNEQACEQGEPGSVQAVGADGLLRIRLDSGGLVDRMPDAVQARVQMPWHPKATSPVMVILLRRNLGHNRVLEGLEVRWGLLVRVLGALTRLGPWRLDGSIGPMHKYYDPSAFDVLSEEEVRRRCAPKRWRGRLLSEEEAMDLTSQGETLESSDVRTVEEMIAAGFNVRRGFFVSHKNVLPLAIAYFFIPSHACS